MTRSEAEIIVKTLPDQFREAVAIIIETTEEQGDYLYNDLDGSYWEDSTEATLAMAARFIREYK